MALIVEFGPPRDEFEHPAHPYTQALLSATAGHEASLMDSDPPSF